MEKAGSPRFKPEVKGQEIAAIRETSAKGQVIRKTSRKLQQKVNSNAVTNQQPDRRKRLV